MTDRSKSKLNLLYDSVHETFKCKSPTLNKYSADE